MGVGGPRIPRGSADRSSASGRGVTEEAEHGGSLCPDPAGGVSTHVPGPASHCCGRNSSHCQGFHRKLPPQRPHTSPSHSPQPCCWGDDFRSQSHPWAMSVRAGPRAGLCLPVFFCPSPHMPRGRRSPHIPALAQGGAHRHGPSLAGRSATQGEGGARRPRMGPV